MSPDLSWSPSPLPLLAGALVTALYVRRWRAVRRAAGPRAGAEAPVWRLVSFCASVLVALAALISPVDSLADQLFFAHMVQHVLLLDVSPILGILGLTRVILRPVTRAVHELERRAGVLAHPAVALVAYIGVIWLWHIPAAYDLAVRHSGVHVLEHLSFFIVGSLYWWHLLSPIRARLRLSGLGPVAYMGATKVFVGALGMGLAFAPSPLYPYYEHHARVWGISAISDQAIAGLIMAVEQSLIMGAALVVLFVRALAESERAQEREERYEELRELRASGSEGPALEHPLGTAEEENAAPQVGHSGYP
ncbi:MAG TPA: cytochrome c oxidase assembly protein [Solirubrobacteraceae bacterium]|jgi:cytochrome c oxidase assembly factor CtaG|nr:cytochrome c oxidase assembly protein [Solirubrobacteraceae bacterium]